MDLDKIKESIELRNLNVFRVLNDAIVFERLSYGLNKLVDGAFGDTIRAKSELYFGVDTAIQLMGFQEDKEEPYITDQLFHCYKNHLQIDLSLNTDKMPDAGDLARKILKDWLKMESEYIAQLN